MLRDKIADEMRSAMKAREQSRVAALRMLMTSVKNAEVEKLHELSDDEVLEVIAREAKRRRESIEASETGASSPKQMGEVMKALMPKVRGRADGAQVSALVKARLGA